jgi:mRNA-degrading endonuclease RelE of RelBE toxin-antitoxin system
MSYKVEVTPKFEKELKRLAKKYPSLKSEYPELVRSLKESPQQGTALGSSCFKIRLPIASKGKGKSGGARIITYLQISETVVYLLTIFDKGEKDNIAPNELKELLNYIV